MRSHRLERKGNHFLNSPAGIGMEVDGEMVIVAAMAMDLHTKTVMALVLEMVTEGKTGREKETDMIVQQLTQQQQLCACVR